MSKSKKELLEDKIEELVHENEDLQADYWEAKDAADTACRQLAEDRERLTDALLEGFPEERTNVHPITGEGTITAVIRLLRDYAKLRG